MMDTLTLGQKLDQRRFSGMSDKMAALVAYILGDEAVRRTEPAIVQLSVLSDGVVVASNDDLTSTMIGSEEDLTRNLTNLLIAAELSPAEVDHVETLYQQRVTTFKETH